MSGVFYVHGHPEEDVSVLTGTLCASRTIASKTGRGNADGSFPLRIYTHHVILVEERKIIRNAANKKRMDRRSTNDL